MKLNETISVYICCQRVLLWREVLGTNIGSLVQIFRFNCLCVLIICYIF